MLVFNGCFNSKSCERVCNLWGPIFGDGSLLISGLGFYQYCDMINLCQELGDFFYLKVIIT